MKRTELRKVLEQAVAAARDAGAVLQRQQHKRKKIDSEEQYDIKLELDRKCQAIVEKRLIRFSAEIPILGEEGQSEDVETTYRWVVDPIDGTVNVAYGIPHACVSIALQERSEGKEIFGPYRSVVGVVFDPYQGELFTVIRGMKAKLNGRIMAVSERKTLKEAIVTTGFAKSKSMFSETLPFFNRLAPKVRKVRMMGSAALSLSYVAAGRFDGYVEGITNIWDVAAGSLLCEAAGGEFWSKPLDGDYKYRLIATNGHIGKALRRLAKG